MKFNAPQYLVFFLLLLFFLPATAQKYKLSGTVKDASQTTLPSATVFMQSVKDSTVVNYTITGDDGRFSLEGKTDENEVDFFITYIGYRQFYKRIVLKETPDNNFGDIILEEANNDLDEIVIQGSAPPITLKKDTLEFNVSSFKTKEDANLEDLLKKLPGVTVDRDGSIKVNGKDVSNIKVNGKDFFGSDPKIATKNLPKDLLEKVQIVDTKSKSDEFTGRESDSEDKTINVVIKEENNKGLFSRLTAGAGSDDRFSVNGIGNYFKNDLRLSALGSANNINSVGFSFDDVFDAMGRNAYRIMNMGNSGGITKSHSAGMDFVNSWNKKAELSADYFYNRTSTEMASDVQRENLLPDKHYFNNSSSSSKSVNNNHRGNAYFSYQPDTLTRISISPNMTANNGFSQDISETDSRDVNGRKLNSSSTEQYSKMNSVDFSNRIRMTRKYGSNGGYFRVGFSNRNNNQQTDRSNFTLRDIFDEDENVVDHTLQDQLIRSDQTQDSYTVDASVRVPLTKTWKLDMDYTFTNGRNNNERLTYEADDNTDVYDVLNEELSSRFKSDNLQHKPSVGVVFTNDKINAGLSGGLESVRLKNEEQFTETTIDNTYHNLFARLYMRYRISQKNSLFFNYNNSRSIPSLNQLQPVTNTTNPLNIITGNPNLKPTLTNRFILSFFNYDYQQHQGYSVFLRGSYDTDQVVARTLTDDDLVRTTTYTNVDGGYDFNVGIRADKEFKLKDKSTLKPQIGLSSSARKDIGFSNGVRFHSDNLSLNPRVNLEFDVPDIININPSYDISFNHAKYSLGNRQNQNYADHTAQLDLTSYWPEKIIFGNTITYSHLGETAPGFDKDFVLWNMSLGYKLIGDDGILKLTVYDLLDQNIATSRRTGEDYIQDTQELVLKRYAMLSFTYKFSKFGGKKSRSGGMRFRRA